MKRSAFIDSLKKQLTDGQFKFLNKHFDLESELLEFSDSDIRLFLTVGKDRDPYQNEQFIKDFKRLKFVKLSINYGIGESEFTKDGKRLPWYEPKRMFHNGDDTITIKYK